MEVKLYNWQGEETGKVNLDPKVFEVEVNMGVVHQAVVTQQLNNYHPFAHTKDRSEVSGGGKKPWRQKGTGRARAGSSRSPIWIGGGVTFGPRKERNFSKKINKKMKQKALFMVLSDKVKSDSLRVIDEYKIDKIKTKEVENFLKNIKASKAALIVTDKKDENMLKSSKNLQKVETIKADSLNIVDVLKYKYLILNKKSLDVISKTYVQGK